MLSMQHNGRSRSRLALPLCLALMSMTSCAHPNGEGGASSSAICAIFDPIYLAEPDIAAISDDAARSIAAHNAIWEGECAKGSRQ
jgi:hypothetical protein